MRRFVTIAMLCIGCLTAVNAQTFTQRLQKSAKGEGQVTVTHDKTIDDLVNGTKAGASVTTAAKTNAKTAEPKADNKKEKQEKSTASKSAEQKTESRNDTITTEPDGQKKVMRNGVKVTGYRVQAFAGGNSRQDRQQAEQTRNSIKAQFPHVPVYVHFYSPRWICRVGNYRTYEEAHNMLVQLRNLGYQSASIVKGKITVQY